MLRMITRLMTGCGVWVMVGIGVNVNVEAGVIVDTVDTSAGVSDMADAWHAIRSIERKT